MFDRATSSGYAAATSASYQHYTSLAAAAAMNVLFRNVTDLLPSTGRRTTMPVLYEKRHQVGVLTLSRPEARNAWGPDFTEGIAHHFAMMEDDDDIRCAVLTGDDKGGAFSAGANLKNPQTHTLPSAADFIKSLPKRKDRQFEVLANFSKPLIGAVNGYAIGVGCIVTFCCDLLIASDRAEWRLPQVALGILPAYGGAARLARWVGKGHAMRLAMGFPLKADEAYRIGLAQWLVPHAELQAKTMEVAEYIAALPPLAAQLTKESLQRGLDIPNLADASLVDLYRFMALESTEDKDEGHAAWREKRKPVFHGR
jgi:enoyl-CoA hydratase/carnithine racemase